MNPKLPDFPTNVSISNSRFQLVCPEDSTRKRVGRRIRVRRRRRRVVKRRRRTTIEIGLHDMKKKKKKKKKKNKKKKL